MIAVIRVTIGVMSLLLAVIVGVRTVSAVQNSPLVALFSAPDGSPCAPPCLFGVRPGETPFNDAVILLKQHPLLRGSEEQLVFGGAGLQSIGFTGIGIHVTVQEDRNKRIEHISIEIAPENVLIPIASMGDTVAFLGTPDFVFIDYWSYVGPLSWVYYHQKNLIIINHQRSISVTIEDPAVRIYSQAAPLKELTGSMPWQGFTTIDRYIPNAIR
jgi:hypothetical protein